MNAVFISAHAAISTLGNKMDEHWEAIIKGCTGIKKNQLDGHHFFGSVIAEQQHDSGSNTFFEKICLRVCHDALSQFKGSKSRMGFILSTTKGNINQLSTWTNEQLALPKTASVIAQSLQITDKPRVVSQACVSGVVALSYAQYLIHAGHYDHILVCGADVLSTFILKGFQSFQAVAASPCRPFDAERSGINLGEAAAAIILSKHDVTQRAIQLSGHGSSNDANHISGPSRTGAELAKAIRQAMDMAQLKTSEIDMISAHGTATVYNDEMEAKALGLCGLTQVPTHSFKSFVGHTFGAAGVLETAMCIEALLRQQLIPSLHYENHGVSVPLEIITKTASVKIKSILKTASGFGGTNAALVLQQN